MAKRKSKSKTVKHRPGTLERQALKRKVRRSPEWAELRKAVAERQGNVDPVTLRPLTKGFNLHHLSQCWQEYGNLQPERFVALNHKTHETAHFIYEIYKREGNFLFLDELKSIVKRMKELTEEDEQRTNIQNT